MKKNYHIEKFEVKRNSLVIRGLAYIPNLGKKFRAVIFSHGFLSNMSMCKTYAEDLSRDGYASFIFDFNGGGLHSKSSGKPIDMSVLTEALDLRSVFEYVSNLDYVRRDDITLIGLSQGGVVSSLVANELKDKIKDLILFYPALCIPDDAKKGKMMFYKFDPENIPEVIGRFPMKLSRKYVTDALKIDYLRILDGYAGPLTIIHGDSDKIVNLSYSRNLIEKYPKGELIVIPGGTHMFHGKCDRLARTILVKHMNDRKKKRG